MAIGLDDALLGWLVASAGDSLARRLRGDPARAAMRQVVEEAVTATVEQVAGGLDNERAEHLRASLLGHNIGAAGEQVQVTNETELRDALQAWTEALDHPEFGEPGYLTSLGLAPDSLADTLTSRITDGIRRDGRRGGALNLLAEWLWRDELSADIGVIKRDLSQLRNVVDPPATHSLGLPGGAAEFVGRHKALATLAEQIKVHDPSGTVVAIHTVDGMAGVGKTELALYAAQQHKHRYPDGQYFLNLHGYTQGIAPMSPETALEELLRQAGVGGRDIPSDAAGRQARWRALMAEKRSIVLLDNALDVAHVQPLLPMSPGCLVLITSRTRMTGLPAAKPLPLDVFAPAEAIELFCRLAGPDRCPDPASVAKVVELAGLLPLSIEILASRMRRDPTLTVAELATDLADTAARLDEISPPGAGVRAAFETSIQHLNQSDRRAFWALGLHPSPIIGVPQFGALANLPASRARSTLRTLTEHHLIKPTPVRTGHRRYEQHDLMREFAREQAALHLSQERTAALARLASWYTTALSVVIGQGNSTSTKETTLPTLDGLQLNCPDEADAWLAAERRNLVIFAAVGTGAEVADMCMAYGHAWENRGQHFSAEFFYRSAAEICGEIGDENGASVAMEHARVVHLARMSDPGFWD